MKKLLPLVLIAGVLALTGVQVSCGSSSKSRSNNNSKGIMYERQKSNKGRKINSNIKVKGTNKANSHTTRSY
jgi:Tfp pilus assembly protein PilV